jgi:hydroxymethylglutaryl-CoA lyase
MNVLPEPVHDAHLPSTVHIYEVGARDGLQNEATVLPTAVKAEFIQRLAAAGLPTIEATSFVRADRVPQLADATELLQLIGPEFPVLVPNQRGLDRALAAGVRHVAVFASATETFAHHNLGCSISKSLDMFSPVVQQIIAEGGKARGYLSMCFGDPWEGPVLRRQVVEVGKALLDMGCYQLSLGDTIGVATAGQVRALIAAFEQEGIGPERLAVHFHDTYGQALANALAALQCGVTTVDSSAGGLGGCPFAKSATGNLATEDLVWFLHGHGIKTGVNLNSLVETSIWMAEQLGRPSPSRVVRALAGRTLTAHGLVVTQ